MRWRTIRGGRGALLSLLCLAAGILPGIAPQTLAVSLGATGSAVSGLPSTAPTSAPPPAVEPTSPYPPLPQLVLGELNNQPAPVPPGPSTYVPILLYHYIRINPNPADRVGFNLSIPPAMFRAQMQYLADHVFHVLSLHQVVQAIRMHEALPSRPVVLTFDDGYADFFTDAVPAMAAHGFTATDFVITGRMGIPGFLTSSQVLAADRIGFTVGAHTVDHLALAALSPARSAWEMRKSKLDLESLLGHPVVDFAYPYGSYNAYDETEARQLGFEVALSTLAGTMHTAGQLMFLSRVRIGGAMSLATYAHLVGGPTPGPGGSR